MRCDNRYCIYWCSTGCCFVMPETCPHRILQPDEQAADTSEAVSGPSLCSATRSGADKGAGLLGKPAIQPRAAELNQTVDPRPTGKGKKK